jgi:hypothetical protein
LPSLPPSNEGLTPISCNTPCHHAAGRAEAAVPRSW